MKKLILLAALPFAFFASAAAADGHMEVGKAKFEAICSDCHYEDHFAGTSEDEIKSLIEAVRAGEVEHDEDLSGLTDDEVKGLAAFFASQG